MAYAYPWNSAVPAGSDPANQLDTYITDLKGALTERLEDKVVQSMVADPWVLKPEVLGNVTGKIYPIHWSDCFIDPNASYTFNNRDISSSALGAQTIRVPVGLPSGVIIQEFRLFLSKGGSNTVAVLKYGSYDTTFAETVVATLTRTSSVLGEESALAINHLVDLTTRVYFIEIAMSLSSEFSFGHIVYDTPDCRNTR